MNRLIAIAVAIAAVFGTGWAVNGWRMNAKIEKLKADHNQIVTKAAEQSRVDLEALRQREKALQRKVDDGNTQRQKDVSVIASLRTDNGGLRKSISDYAQGSTAIADTAAACRDRAQTLGTLLDTALQADRQSSLDAESESANVRALLDTWPR